MEVIYIVYSRLTRNIYTILQSEKQADSFKAKPSLYRVVPWKVEPLPTEESTAQQSLDL